MSGFSRHATPDGLAGSSSEVEANSSAEEVASFARALAAATRASRQLEGTTGGSGGIKGDGAGRDVFCDTRRTCHFHRKAQVSQRAKKIIDIEVFVTRAF
jgi:hypothetical protein